MQREIEVLMFLGRRRRWVWPGAHALAVGMVFLLGCGLGAGDGEAGTNGGSSGGAVGGGGDVEGVAGGDVAGGGDVEGTGARGNVENLAGEDVEGLAGGANVEGLAGGANVEGDPADLTLLGTPTRPQLSAALADEHSVLKYLARAGNLTTGLETDNWDPTAGAGDVATFTASFRVAVQGGTHTSIQEAISAAVAVGGTARQYIEVAPGTYRELVCVPTGAPPITLYGSSADASQTIIVFDNYSGKPKAVGSAANPCNANLNGETYGTSGSATFAAYAREFHAKNLSIVNDTDEATASGGVQAVALMTQGDRLIFDNVRVLGNQDSLFVKTPNVDTVVRAYFKNCHVEGDTDFIFGRGTFVLDGCTIHSLTSRTAGGVIVAPSTPWQNPYGILITRSTFTADATAGAESTHLGRAWDESQVDVATYTANVQSGAYPNGQALIAESTLGPHIQAAAPWRPAATTSRPYSSIPAGSLPANRLYEHLNAGPGSAAP